MSTISGSWDDKCSQLSQTSAAKSHRPLLRWHPYKPPVLPRACSPLLCCRVGEVTLRMQGVSWPSLSCEESLERSLERRLSRERSQPPLAPCKLIFLCSASARDALTWLLLIKRKEVITITFPPTRPGHSDGGASDSKEWIMKWCLYRVPGGLVLTSDLVKQKSIGNF